MYRWGRFRWGTPGIRAAAVVMVVFCWSQFVGGCMAIRYSGLMVGSGGFCRVCSSWLVFAIVAGGVSCSIWVFVGVSRVGWVIIGWWASFARIDSSRIQPVGCCGVPLYRMVASSWLCFMIKPTSSSFSYSFMLVSIGAPLSCEVRFLFLCFGGQG